MKKRLFTLIELLVVVAIVMILIALLLPALSRVRYRAKLVVCANAMHQAGSSALLHAADHDKRYFKRDAVAGAEFGCPAVAKEFSLDDRPLWREWNLDEIFCPFSGQPDFESGKRNIIGSISHYAGSRFKTDVPGVDAGANGMFRIGKPLIVGGKKFDILVADVNFVNTVAGYARAGHPDVREGMLTPPSYPSSVMENVWWYNSLTVWGGLDLNFGREDGSVFTMKNVSHSDDRLSRVPYKYTNYGISLNKAWSLLPNVDQGN